MTHPDQPTDSEQAPTIPPAGIDIEADPADLDALDRPATSDPAQFTQDDDTLGGVGGPSAGGAG